MQMSEMVIATIFLTIALYVSQAHLAIAQSSVDQLQHDFISPPNAAKPRVWWHWMNGNITQKGIQLDLDWMSRVGLGGVQTFDAAYNTPQIVDQRLVFMSAPWESAFRSAVTLADELGLEFAIAGSPGWSESGGPWVKPEQGMKKLVWIELRVTGGVRLTGKLPRPPANVGPFQDISVLRGLVSFAVLSQSRRSPLSIAMSPSSPIP